MVITRHGKGDRERVCQLFTRHTSYLRDTAFWLWIHRIWPDEDSIIYLAKDGEDVVGHYAVLPFTLCNGKERLRAGLGVHAFIAPPYRKKMPIFYLTRQCYQACKEEGIDVLFGFPNENFRLIQEKVEGWHCVSSFLAWTRPVKSEDLPSLSLPSSLAVRPLDWNAPADLALLDDLFTLSPSPAAFHVPRSLSLWKRRFAQHPQVTYRPFFVFSSKSEETFPLAAFVLKEFENLEKNELVGHLMDYVALPPLSHAALIDASVSAFSPRVSSLAYWPVHSVMEDTLREKGFIEDGFSTFFAIKILNDSLEEHPLLRKKKAWHLPLSLSDAF